MLPLALLFLGGCSSHISAEKVPGKYRADCPYGTEILILNVDGTFLQRMSVPGSPQRISSGKWTFDARDSRIELERFMAYDVAGQTVKSGWASMDVEMMWFKILIGSASGNPYVKQEN